MKSKPSERIERKQLEPQDATRYSKQKNKDLKNLTKRELN